MSLYPMAPGGRWMRPPHDAPPVYVPAKQIEAHYKRLVGENWTPIDDPRREEEMQQAHAHVQAEVANVSAEVALQARIDQLEALVMKLLTEKSEHDGSTINASGTDSQGPQTDQRPGRRKPAV